MEQMHVSWIHDPNLKKGRERDDEKGRNKNPLSDQRTKKQSLPVWQWTGITNMHSV